MKLFTPFYITILLLIITIKFTYSQTDKTFINQTFQSNIKTVLLHNIKDPLSYPIIHLNSNEKLILSFDDLDNHIKEYQYTFIHCDANWNESNLIKSEYIDGFITNPIIDYEFSFNTSQKYIHYNLIFPEDNSKPVLSGNYVIKVLLQGNPDTTILTKRFMILEEKVIVSPEVKRSNLINYRDYKQKIDFSIIYKNLEILDPINEIQVSVKQNNREDNSIKDLYPLFVKRDRLIYNYEVENSFDGNNEFRFFDTKSIRYQSERISSISEDSSVTNVYLFTDVGRKFKGYSIEPDLNGNFLINKQEAWNSEIEADYINVHFSLLSDQEISYGDFYLFGRFTDWNILNEYKMIYNPERKLYEKVIYLKQGYYNYLYALNDNSTQRINTPHIEGNYYETRNDYYIYVYYKEIGTRYDQLIGYIKTSSKSLF